MSAAFLAHIGAFALLVSSSSLVLGALSPGRALVSAQPIRRSVISVGLLPKLMSLREQVVSSAGNIVYTTMDLHEAVAKIDEGAYDVLLLCYSVQDEWRQRLIAHFREHSPKGRIVAITNYPITETPK